MPYDKDVKFGDLMTIADFKEAVEQGAFIDYDGYGHPAVVKQDASIGIVPSGVDKIPEDATHIVWFNR